MFAQCPASLSGTTCGGAAARYPLARGLWLPADARDLTHHIFVLFPASPRILAKTVRPYAAQAASAPPRVAGCPWSLAFGDQGIHNP